MPKADRTQTTSSVSGVGSYEPTPFHVNPQPAPISININVNINAQLSNTAGPSTQFTSGLVLSVPVSEPPEPEYIEKIDIACANWFVRGDTTMQFKFLTSLFLAADARSGAMEQNHAVSTASAENANVNMRRRENVVDETRCLEDVKRYLRTRRRCRACKKRGQEVIQSATLKTQLQIKHTQ